MKITLTDPDRDDRTMNGEVSDVQWVQGCIDAAWAYLNHTGAGEIIVRSKDELVSSDGSAVRICTVALTIHDEDEA